MTDLYEFHSGRVPLLVSIPHAGTNIPDTIFGRFSNAGKKLPDTDWFVPRLYEFVKELGAHLIVANFSRYIIDLNRPPDDQSLYEDDKATGLVPKILFDGSPLYAAEEPFSEEDINGRMETYWRPYHAKLTEVITQIKEEHGYALLYDAHSIASRIPHLFKGKIPDFNLGTANAESCAPEIGYAIAEVIRASDFTSTINGRFIGGYITRHYGKPDKKIHAVQMEIGQAAYMDEDTKEYDEEKAEKLIPVLRDVINANLNAIGN